MFYGFATRGEVSKTRLTTGPVALVSVGYSARRRSVQLTRDPRLVLGFSRSDRELSA